MFYVFFSIVALFGHFAICIASLNRMHSVAVPPWFLRGFNLVWVVFCLGLPALVGSFVLVDALAAVRVNDSLGAMLFNLYLVYGSICWMGTFVALFHLMFSVREAPTTTRLQSNHTIHMDVAEHLGTAPIGDFLTGLSYRIPRNQICQLSIQTKDLVLPRLPRELDGLSIVHLSDLHFTGQLKKEFFHETVRQANLLKPDLIAITGDIIDKRSCLPWIKEILGNLQSKYGTYYVLGNHDRRVKDDNAVRNALASAGMINVGARWRRAEVRGMGIIFAGNELPWYGPAADLQDCPQTDERGQRPFRIALTHTPDQIDWACLHDFDMMLAGHTHEVSFACQLSAPC